MVGVAVGDDHRVHDQRIGIGGTGEDLRDTPGE